MTEPRGTEPLVTAIVSTYAAERYIRGCLEDLLAQTLGERLEILVIDACSPQGEGPIVREYARAHANIRYLRTETREYSSEVFNRAAQLARGKYLTTANTDDRHRPDFGERMAQVLDAHPEFGIVYADSLITRVDNETFAGTTATTRQAWPDYTHATALSCCLFGAQPVWRKSAHEHAGLWDPSHRHANDQDLFLRIAARCGAVHLRETLGLFLARPDSVSGSDHRADTLRDVLAVMRKYRTSMPLEALFPLLPEHEHDPFARAAALFELGNLCALGPYTDAHLALDCYRRAVDLPLAGPDTERVRAAFANNTACVLACAGAFADAGRAWRLATALPAAAQNERLARGAAARGELPRLQGLAFATLRHPVVLASRRTRALRIAASGELCWSEEHEQVPWDVFEGPNGVPVANAGRMRPRKHVMLVMYGWADSGGGTILPRQVARELATRGQRVTVFHADARERAGLEPYSLVRGHEDGVELYGLCNRPALFMDLADPGREVDDPRVCAIFAGLLDDLGPDVVHFYNLHNLGMSLPLVCKQRGIPTVYSSNNYWALCPRLYLASERVELCTGPSEDGSKCVACLGTAAPAAAYAARRAAGLAMLDEHIDVHLAVSERVRELHVQNGADPARIRVLLQAPPSSDAIWRKAGSRRKVVERLERPLRVAFVGSVLPHKGVHVLARALQMLPRASVECVVLGDVARDYLAQLRGLDAAAALHFAGAYRQEDLPEYFAKIDVVVVPSIWEDCAPLVVAEALAAKAPVLGSHIGGIPDFVEHGVNGLLFAPGDAAGLARCLRAFAEDRGLLGRMQAAIAAPAGFGAYVEAVLGAYTARPSRKEFGRLDA